MRKSIENNKYDKQSWIEIFSYQPLVTKLCGTHTFDRIVVDECGHNKTLHYIDVINTKLEKSG